MIIYYRYSPMVIDKVLFAIFNFIKTAQLNPYVIEVVMLILVYFVRGSDLDELQTRAVNHTQLKASILSGIVSNDQDEDILNHRKEFIINNLCDLANEYGADVKYDELLEFVNSNMKETEK